MLQPSSRRAPLSARRVVLLATVAGVGAAALFAGADSANRGVLSAIGTAVAETPQRPAGFGDLVEKVKPAVISVRVKKVRWSGNDGL
jgi:serine protease Do